MASLPCTTAATRARAAPQQVSARRRTYCCRGSHTPLAMPIPRSSTSGAPQTGKAVVNDQPQGEGACPCPSALVPPLTAAPALCPPPSSLSARSTAKFLQPSMALGAVGHGREEPRTPWAVICGGIALTAERRTQLRRRALYGDNRTVGDDARGQCVGPSCGNASPQRGCALRNGSVW